MTPSREHRAARPREGHRTDPASPHVRQVDSERKNRKTDGPRDAAG